MTPNELYARIPGLYSPERQPPIEGWCNPPKAFALVAAVLTIRPEVCVQIGVFGGSSLLPVAIALNYLARGQIIGIDPYDPVESAKGQTGANLKWWSELDHAKIERGFMDAVIAEGVSNQVVVLKKTSDAVTPPDRIQFLIVDGNHGEQGFRDIKRYCVKVPVGGLTFVDDITWEGGAIGRGVAWMLANGFTKLYDLDTGAMYQRIAFITPNLKLRKPRKA